MSRPCWTALRRGGRVARGAWASPWARGPGKLNGPGGWSRSQRTEDRERMAQSVKPLNRKDAGLRTSEGRRCRLLGRKVYGVIVDAREPFVGDAPCTRPLLTSLLVTRVIDGFMARGGAPIAGDDTWLQPPLTGPLRHDGEEDIGVSLAGPHAGVGIGIPDTTHGRYPPIRHSTPASQTVARDVLPADSNAFVGSSPCAS
jgi:hypothetical protein